MNTYFRLLQYAKPYKWLIPQYFVYTLLFVLFSVVNLAVLAPLLNLLFKPASTAATETTSVESNPWSLEQFYIYLNEFIATQTKEDALYVICLILIISVVFANLFNYLTLMLQAKARINAVTNLRNSVFNRITELDMGYFTDARKGDLMTKVSTDVQNIEATIVNSLTVLFKEPFLIMGYFFILFFISTELTLYTLLLVPVSGSAISYIAKRLKRRAQFTQESISRLTNILEETLSGIRVIKAFNAQWYTQKKFTNEAGVYAHQSMRMAKKANLSAPLAQVLGTSMLCLILLIGGHMVLSDSHQLDPSKFILFLITFGQLIVPAKNIANAFTNIQKGLVSSERVFQLIDTPIKVTDHANAQDLINYKSHISFKGVHFAYGDRKVLNDISFHIAKGSTVAMVGQSGGGKSTIADLLARFYDPAEGSIRVDGQDIKDITISSLRKKMGIVTQESILFNDTIRQNISFGKAEADLEEIITAAKIANAHQFIMQLEKGYDTIIGERGSKLSGGQKQRMSIARALLKNPEILILDEATSALDSESEKLVQDAILNLTKNRTTLVIAHRLSTIQNADLILVLKAGKIIQSGTHLELIKEAGVYKTLLEIQNLPHSQTAPSSPK
ncbi:MAG: ABC transporter ATP-binding protein [Cytophagales bacterium]|jgi:subfamily B ATP-binding cassette protein MsbA|tara:strand:+ start:92532 stop:94382 length:1851 start_codon:yes stop_codon:yes gene_type:complete